MNVATVVRGLVVATVIGAALSAGAVSSGPIVSSRCVAPVAVGSARPVAILPTPPDPCQGR
jgi:hypothetical protein